MAIRERVTARLILLDSAQRVLLMQYHDDKGERFWASPGGALEAGEEFAQAARREAGEELGLPDLALTELWRETVEIQHRGDLILQLEQYFLARVEAGDLSLTDRVRREHQREGILALRWWTIAELVSTAERIFPEGLAARLQQLAPLA